MPKTILTVVGARPQFIKAAAVSRAIMKHGTVQELLLHTGQHYDQNMSDVFFRDLEIPSPEYHLDVGGGPHGKMTGRMLELVEEIAISREPSAILVYGDTNSTLAGSLAGAKLHIPVVHIEAGLRSFNRRMPEEINRVLTDHVSSLLFCPTSTAVQNLKQEGIHAGVHFVGDVMYDATLFAQSRALSSSTIVHDLGVQDGCYTLATVHRAENTDTREALLRIVEWLENEACTSPVIIPLHPRTRKAMETFDLQFQRVKAIGPVGYFDMNRLLHGAKQVATDSGGLQKEAYFYHKPCVTLRNETEWTELIDAGWNRLWSSTDFLSPRRDITDFGTGNSADAIAAILSDFLTSEA